MRNLQALPRGLRSPGTSCVRRRPMTSGGVRRAAWAGHFSWRPCPPWTAWNPRQCVLPGCTPCRSNCKLEGTPRRNTRKGDDTDVAVELARGLSAGINGVYPSWERAVLIVLLKYVHFCWPDTMALNAATSRGQYNPTTGDHVKPRHHPDKC